jgi:hypothetical protein
MLKVYKQLSIFLANVPGTLAKVLKILANKKINLLGMMVFDSVDHAVIRMVVNDPIKATHLLGNHGLLVIESDVLGIQLEDKPGALLKIAARLAAAKVNISYTYATDGAGGDVMAFLRPANMSKAKQALKGMMGGPKRPKRAKRTKR